MSDISSAVLSYLETLSREKLIELINYFAATHEDILCILEEKAGAVSTKAEPADIFAQSQPELPAADISTTSSQVLVTRNSTPQEKIDLYTSLFVGRQDVFALRWYNANSNKSGYSPVCENKWQSGKCDMKKYSCASCPFKLPVPLSDGYIFNHLAGKDSA